jgi:uncharacterized membrane protein YkoI
MHPDQPRNRRRSEIGSKIAETGLLCLSILYESSVMKNLTATGLCIGVLCLPCAVLAQTVSQAPNYPAADIGAFHGNQKTLTSAIQKIQQSTGGKVVEIRFAGDETPRGFLAAVAKDGKVQFVLLDQSSGKVIPTQSRPDWTLKWQQKTDVQLAEHASVPLPQAVTTAEKSTNAPAIAAGIARSASMSSVHAYNILLADAGSVKRVAVDSSTGQVIADPAQLEAWP